MRRCRLIGLVVLVGVTGCGTIAVLSGPRVLKAGDTATYVLALGGVDLPGNSTLYLGCDVPSSWALLNNSYLGTAGGNPVSGSALVTTTYDTDDIPPPGDSNQRIWLTDGPF